LKTALQALLTKLSPEDTQDGKPMTPEQLAKISDKLGDLLGDAGAEHRNQRGEVRSPPARQRFVSHNGQLVNEEGLPIIEIAEPIPAVAPSPAFAQLPSSTVVADAVLSQTPLSPQARERERAELDAFFDLMEEEEAEEEARAAMRERQREREEHEQRKAHAAKELERIRAAKSVQKKMGQALLRGLGDPTQITPGAPAEKEKGKGKGKKVAFAEGTADEKPVASSSRVLDAPAPGKFRPADQGHPMKFKVVERVLTKAPPVPHITATLTAAPEGDSDDESAVATSEDSVGGARDSLPTSDASDGDDDEPPVDPVLADEIDFDQAMHQREVALAYYEKRAVVGQDTARAMAAHTHVPGEDEWDQSVRRVSVSTHSGACAGLIYRE
jgi:hypothetical protein